MTTVNRPTELDGIRVLQHLDNVITALRNGESVARFEFGDSMQPILVSGQYAKLEPIDVSEVQTGDAVFCKVNGGWMTHMVWIKNRDTNDCLIGSTSGQLYGWASEVLAIARPIPYKEEE